MGLFYRILRYLWQKSDIVDQNFILAHPNQIAYTFLYPTNYVVKQTVEPQLTAYCSLVRLFQRNSYPQMTQIFTDSSAEIHVHL